MFGISLGKEMEREMKQIRRGKDDVIQLLVVL